MFNINVAPKGFIVVSRTPTLKIEYHSQANSCLTIALSLYVCMMTAATIIVILDLPEIFRFMYTLIVEDDLKSIMIAILYYGCIGGVNLYLTISFVPGLLLAFSINTYVLGKDSLTIVKKVLGVGIEAEIYRNSLKEIRRNIIVSEDITSNEKVYTWELVSISNSRNSTKLISSWLPNFIRSPLEKLICNQKSVKKMIVLLDSSQPYDRSNWLGEVLADFYHIEYYSSYF